MRSAALPGDASPPWKRGSGTERGRWTWTGPNRRLAAASPRCLLPYFLACQQRGRWAGPRRRDNNSAVRSGDRQTPTPPPGAPAGRRAPARHLSRGAGARRPVVHWCWGAAALRLSGTGRGVGDAGNSCARRCGPCRLRPLPGLLTAWDGRADVPGLFRGSCPGHATLQCCSVARGGGGTPALAEWQ